MKKMLPVFMALGIFVGCTTVEAIPNVYDQGQIFYSDSTEVLSSPFIYEGVRVEGLDVSGTNLESIKPILEEGLGKKLDESLTIVYGDKTKTLSLKDLGYSINYDNIAKEALKIGRDGSDEERLALIEDLKTNPVDIKAELVLNEKVVQDLAKSLASEVDVKPVEAEYSYDSATDSVVATSGVNGHKLNQGKLVEDIKAAAGNTDKVEAEIESINVAENAQENAKRVNGVIGFAESRFNTGFWERVENIRVSTLALDNLVLGPGETFSFNDYIGDTTYEKGYQQSIVIDENNREVPGMGGGVCQTSTALYHAALKSDLMIINRSPHTQFMPYSPGGLDAAVEYGSADLAFTNDFDFPILIKSYYEPGYITFTIYGDTNVKDYDVSIFSEQFAYNGYSAYKRNEATGEVTYLGDTVYPPAN